MTAFTKDEQWDHNYDLFIADSSGRIGHLSHVGFRLLPPSIAKSKENWKTLFDYFNNLLVETNNYIICHELSKHLNDNFLGSFDEYLEPSAKMSSRGLYSYDSYDYSSNERPYFRVTIPKNELILDDLPQDIRNILENLRTNEINFAQDSLIPEKIISKL